MENVSGISSVYPQLLSPCHGSHYTTSLFRLSFGVLLLLAGHSTLSVSVQRTIHFICIIILN